MEWAYLVLILVFASWSAQMIFAYGRQAERLNVQIQQARESQDEVSEQAVRYEEQANAKKAALKELEHQADDLAAQEETLQSEILGLQQKEGSRRPTRHRVEHPKPPGEG